MPTFDVITVITCLEAMPSGLTALQGQKVVELEDMSFAAIPTLRTLMENRHSRMIHTWFEPRRFIHVRLVLVFRPPGLEISTDYWEVTAAT